MFFVNVFLKVRFSAKDPGAVLTMIPVIFFLVSLAALAFVGRPSSVAPVTLYLVHVRVAIVEVLLKTFGFEGPVAAFAHGGKCGRGMSKKLLIVMESNEVALASVGARKMSSTMLLNTVAVKAL